MNTPFASFCCAVEWSSTSKQRTSAAFLCLPGAAGPWKASKAGNKRSRNSYPGFRQRQGQGPAQHGTAPMRGFPPYPPKIENRKPESHARKRIIVSVHAILFTALSASPSTFNSSSFRLFLSLSLSRSRLNQELVGIAWPLVLRHLAILSGNMLQNRNVARVLLSCCKR